MTTSILQSSLFVLLLALCTRFSAVDSLTPISRRQALAVTAASTLTIPDTAAAAAPQQQQQPMVTLANTNTGAVLQIPQIGYSLYKTPAAQVPNGVRTALAAGVRHLDVATQYGTNAAVANVLQDYVQHGAASLVLPNEDNKNSDNTTPLSLAAHVPRTAAQRKSELYVTHKVSNAEQALSTQELQAAVLQQQEMLIGKNGNKNNFLVMIHSPLTNREQRLRTYAALQDLHTKGHIAAVGVCHYGVAHLQEIIEHNLPPPAVVQLELSPFQRHANVAAWAAAHGNIPLSCAAWSRLSSTAGPQDQWAAVAALASKKGVTKQQVLIRWALQSGYLCVPRSSAQFKVERAAIRENAWPAIRTFTLTNEEMGLLNSLDIQLPVGQLGVTDGWEPEDIVDAKWDPTLLTT